MVDLDAFTDLSGLTDDDASSMVNEERRTDFRARMDIDSGL